MKEVRVILSPDAEEVYKHINREAENSELIDDNKISSNFVI